MGVSGGIQLTEPAGEHVVLKAHLCESVVIGTKDSILRFGGSCSMELEWPEESLRGEDKDQIAKVESLAKRVLRRVTQEHKESDLLKVFTIRFITLHPLELDLITVWERICGAQVAAQLSIHGPYMVL